MGRNSGSHTIGGSSQENPKVLGYDVNSSRFALQIHQIL